MLTMLSYSLEMSSPMKLQSRLNLQYLSDSATTPNVDESYGRGVSPSVYFSASRRHPHEWLPQCFAVLSFGDFSVRRHALPSSCLFRCAYKVLICPRFRAGYRDTRASAPNSVVKAGVSPLTQPRSRQSSHDIEHLAPTYPVEHSRFYTAHFMCSIVPGVRIIQEA